MIEIKDVRAGYHDFEVVHGVSTRFDLGQVIVLIGPNGSGKTTLLKTILGLHEKNSGQILIDGVDTDTMSPKERAKKMAYMAQNRNTPSIVSRRMVLHGRFPYMTFSRRYTKEDYQIADQAMKWADAEDIADCYVSELSGGQQQKVYLAMALAQTTPVIFMDEPANFLDVKHQLNVMKLARSLADSGKAVILVLHDLRMAMKVADKIIVMHDGKLVCEGQPEEVFSCGLIDTVFETKLRRFQTDSGWQYYYDE